MNIIYGLLAVIIVWSGWGYFSSHVEQAKYTVLESRNGYEIRLYPAHIVAETTVAGSYSAALNEGFRIVAGYIFGGNAKKQSIAMTAPVMEKSAVTGSSESIAMTAPVTATVDGGSHTIAFGMPGAYTIDTLPTPTDPRVKIVQVPEKKMAAVRFSWFRTDARVNSKKNELLAALKRDNVVAIGEPQYAGYNAPWTPPWMVKNEVMVEVR